MFQQDKQTGKNARVIGPDTMAGTAWAVPVCDRTVRESCATLRTISDTTGKPAEEIIIHPERFAGNE